MNEYIKPEFGLEYFTCPVCNKNHQQKWYKLSKVYIKVTNFGPNPTTNEKFLTDFKDSQNNHFQIHNTRENYSELPQFYVSMCHCSQYTIWENGEIIYPKTILVPQPHEMMPQEVKNIYLEAAQLSQDSFRASAALLRLALQLLLKEIGGQGKNINDDIGTLLKEEIIHAEVQKACDTLRVIGNESVHPGQIDIQDTKEITTALFHLMNYIVKETIEAPAQRDALYELLPNNAKEGIENRNKHK
jgi:hypothetical protein